MAQNRRFLACWASFFAEMSLEGVCWASFFAIQQSCDPVGRTLSRRVPGSRALLLAVLTLQCAAKPYWWHGGQPARAATYRVNVRIGGPTCALGVIGQNVLVEGLVPGVVVGGGQVLWSGVIVLCPSGWVMR